jgi:5-methyltetrahydropteroyltriglutamate--homocysteine methyltransferase
MAKQRPPFRADEVGSLLRPAKLKQARTRHEAGEIDDDALRQVEDESIKEVIAKQEEVGLNAVTDGEFRRAWWHFDFLEELDGMEGFTPESGIQFKGVQTKARNVRMTGKLGFSDHPFLEHFKFTAANTKGTPKQTIPSPSVMHFRGGRAAINAAVYPDQDEFFHDLGETYAAAVRAFYEAGCRYLQFDDTVWGYLCSGEQRDMVRARGEDPGVLPDLYARTINQATAARPDDMTITMHVCRGNFQSQWISEGGYEPVADVLFNQVDIDGYFLEYDTDRAGGFEPLRFMPKGDKNVVLGLVTSKSGELEDRDQIKTRIEEATQYVALDQLCLSPQCGFASTEEGNLLSESQQWDKLRMIVEVAGEVWDGR